MTAWTWAGLCGISTLWVRPDHRKDGWGAKILAAAEAEARRRGCDRVCVSSFTFQAPGFYQKYGHAETGERWASPVAARTCTCSSAFSRRLLAGTPLQLPRCFEGVLDGTSVASSDVATTIMCLAYRAGTLKVPGNCRSMASR